MVMRAVKIFSEDHPVFVCVSVRGGLLELCGKFHGSLDRKKELAQKHPARIEKTRRSYYFHGEAKNE
jgi:hypothetical protein